MNLESVLLLNAMKATEEALGRDPEHDDGRGVVTWKGIRVYYDKDMPDESGVWESEGIPQALWELLMDEHEDEILLAIYEEERV